jgi:hypothetical protein
MKDFKLDSNEKITSGFKIPDTYFDDFSEKVMQRLTKEEPKVISFYAKNKRWLYSAAAVVVLALSVPIVYQMQNNETEMTSKEVESYLVNHTTLSDDDVVNLLDQEDIEKLKKGDTPIAKEALEDVLSNNTEIEQYITNEN